MANKKNIDTEDALLGIGLLALLALAIGAAAKAQSNAKKNDVPYVIEEDGNLYEVSPDGTRKIVGVVKNPRYPINGSKFRF